MGPVALVSADERMAFCKFGSGKVTLSASVAHADQVRRSQTRRGAKPHRALREADLTPRPEHFFTETTGFINNSGVANVHESLLPGSGHAGQQAIAFGP